MRRSFVLAVTLVSAMSGQTSLVPPDVLFLAKTLRHLRQALTFVPNYTCMETLYRENLTPPERKFRQVDRVRLEVAKVGKKEVFGWPGAGRLGDQSIVELAGQGGLVADRAGRRTGEDRDRCAAGQAGASPAASDACERRSLRRRG
jgi:hypothetical protein